ncbi:hypothetical protein FGO68_gene16340 [Halteria grandinella]|uniref:Uncharacterized protein n=1 Tax=Halteria grandinella TaxID=5974 RepID=A0A8J8NBE3_HALGN|nr:hypothetical protein FGO68_gene16340 [Halteria grandinella]
MVINWLLRVIIQSVEFNYWIKLFGSIPFLVNKRIFNLDLRNNQQVFMLMSKIYKILLFVSIGFVIIFFYRFVLAHAINVPYLDDFKTINTIVRVQDNPQHWWSILSEDFNGHRFTEIRAILFLDYWLEGRVNLITLCFFGSLFMLGFWAVSAKIMMDNKVPLFYLLPFTLILFQPIYHRNLFWMLSCLQYIQSIFLTIASYYLLGKRTWFTFIAAIILGIIHTNVNGNAVYVYFLGGIILLYQKQYLRAVIYYVSAFVLGGLFYRGMPTVVGLAGYSLHDLLVSNPLNLIGTLTGFIGSSVYQFSGGNKYIVITGILLIFIMGIILSGYCIIVLRRMIGTKITLNEKVQNYLNQLDELYQNKSAFVMLAGSMLMTAVGVTISRGVHFSGVMVVERYLIYSVVCIAIGYMLLILFTKGKARAVIGIIMLPLSLIFCWHSYYTALPQVLNFQLAHEADIYDLKYHRTTNTKMFTFEPTTLGFFEKTLKRGIYKFPPSRFDSLENKLSKAVDNNTVVDSSFQFTIERDTLPVYGGVRVIHVRNKKFNVSEKSCKNTYFMILKNVDNNEIYLVYPFRNTLSMGGYFRTGNRFDKGFDALLHQDSVKRGRYRIGFLIFENGATKLQYTDKIIDVDNTKLIEWMQQYGFYKQSLFNLSFFTRKRQKSFLSFLILSYLCRHYKSGVQILNFLKSYALSQNYQLKADGIQNRKRHNGQGASTCQCLLGRPNPTFNYEFPDRSGHQQDAQGDHKSFCLFEKSSCHHQFRSRRLGRRQEKSDWSGLR